MPLITAENTFALGALLFGLAWLGFYIDERPLGKKTSGVVWVLVLSMVLSNVGAIPLESPVYGFAFGTLVPMAIPLLLLRADLRLIFKQSGRVMITFLVAAAATLTGAALGFFLFDLGDIGAQVAGVYAGGWIGGAVNFLAVAEAVELAPTDFSAALSASSVVSVLALMSLLALPTLKWLSNFLPAKDPANSETADDKSQAPVAEPAFKLTHVSGLLALAMLIVFLGNTLGEALTGSDQYNILFVTVVTLLVANLFPRQVEPLQGDFALGMLCMYLFFAAIGASTNASAFLQSAVILFFFGCFIIAVHLALVIVAARLLKVELAEAIVASGAALVGPAATAAIASARGWRSLVTPGIMCGIFGYAIATFLGVALTRLLS
ncbi:MAG: DUF819 family protein [Pseudomonadota bacterium]